MPAGLEIVALLAREDPRDVLIINNVVGASTLDEMPAGSRIGTSSLRRRSQLLAVRPDLEVVDLRGNVPTRLKKVDQGQVHAAILAAAGLHRLGVSQQITAYLDAPAWLPAAGQGAIAIQIRTDDSGTRAILAPLGDEQTMIDVRGERAFLAALEGGCQVPIGALAIHTGGEMCCTASLVTEWTAAGSWQALPWTLGNRSRRSPSGEQKLPPSRGISSRVCVGPSICPRRSRSGSCHICDGAAKWPEDLLFGPFEVRDTA
jgi:hydroxymethylbilane synthase